MQQCCQVRCRLWLGISFVSDGPASLFTQNVLDFTTNVINRLQEVSAP